MRNKTSVLRALPPHLADSGVVYAQADRWRKSYLSIIKYSYN